MVEAGGDHPEEGQHARLSADLWQTMVQPDGRVTDPQQLRQVGAAENRTVGQWELGREGEGTGGTCGRGGCHLSDDVVISSRDA